MTIYRLLPGCILVLAAFSFSRVAHPTALKVERFNMEFFAQSIQIDFAPDMIIQEAPERTLDERSVETIYNALKKRPNHIFLKSLMANREALQLNDFLFYKLAKQSLSVIYSGDHQATREISLFHFLGELGFDVRLTYKANRAYVNVYTDEELFEVPIIDDRGRAYANISCLSGECSNKQRLFIFQERPNPTGRSFGFQLDTWPNLQAQPTKKPLQFNFRGQTQQLEVLFDKTMVDIMADYPFIHEYAYLETPLSATLSNSLLPQLRRMLDGLSEREQLELLVSFTRSAFDYKEDNAYFGRSKPMVPEELFSYDYSDCEDRSALFYALVKELLNKSMAVIAYDDHLTVAVESADIPGDFFNYEGKRYIFCDPTGPKQSSRVGQIPPGYENKSFQIIGQHN